MVIILLVVAIFVVYACIASSDTDTAILVVVAMVILGSLFVAVYTVGSRRKSNRWYYGSKMINEELECNILYPINKEKLSAEINEFYRELEQYVGKDEAAKLIPCRGSVLQPHDWRRILLARRGFFTSSDIKSLCDFGRFECSWGWERAVV